MYKENHFLANCDASFEHRDTKPLIDAAENANNPTGEKRSTAEVEKDNTHTDLKMSAPLGGKPLALSHGAKVKSRNQVTTLIPANTVSTVVLPIFFPPVSR